MKSSDRFSRIQQLLKTRRFVKKQEFLEELEVSPSTFKRDLEFLRSRHQAPILWDIESQGYTLASPESPPEIVQEFPGLWLIPREIQALLLIDHLIQHLHPGFLESHLNPLKKRARILLDAPDKNVEQILKRTRIFRPAGRKFDPLHFEKIAEALVDRKRIKIAYRSRSKNEATSRELSPQRFVYYKDNWYLDAWCHLRSELRSFSVDKIQSVSLSKAPAKDLSEEALDSELSSGYGIFSGSAVQKAVLRFCETRARWIASEQWHPQQKSYFKDRHYYLEIPYSDDRELILDILRYGPDVEVLEPASLREKVIVRLKEALGIYGKK